MASPSPLALVIAGPPGVGKTSTGRALARELGAAFLDLDTLTNPLVDVVADLVGVAGDYAEPQLARLVRDPRYTCLADTAAECLGVGVPVVLVAPFTRERSSQRVWDSFADQLRKANGEPHLVWLRGSAELIMARMAQRGAQRDERLLGDLKDGLAAAAVEAPPVEHLEVDAALPVDEQVVALLECLWNRGSV